MPVRAARHLAVILALSLFSSGAPVFAQGDDFNVSSGEESTTVKPSQIVFSDAATQPDARFRISDGTREDMLLVGLDVLTDFVPYAAQVKTAISLTNFAADVAVDSVDLRNDQVAGDLIVIDKDAQRLKEMVKNHQSLDSREGRDLLGRFKERSKDQGGSLAFAGRAIFSADGLYVTVKNAGFEFLSRYLGERLSKTFDLGDAVKRGWKGEGRVAKGLTRTEWAHLKKRAEIAKKLTETLKESLLELEVSRFLEDKYNESVDRLYQEIMNRHPSAPVQVSSPGDNFRIIIATQPVQVLPRLQAIVPQRAPVTAIAARPLIVPPRMAQFRDPVANAVLSEEQVVNQQNYSSSPSPPPASSPSDESTSFPPLTPRREPDTPSQGSRIGNFYVDPSRLSFDGNKKNIFQ